MRKAAPIATPALILLPSFFCQKNTRVDGGSLNAEKSLSLHFPPTASNLPLL
jgi:hypothetical protein